MARLLVLCLGLAGLTLGCMGPNQLSGSVSELFPLDGISRVDVRSNPQALQLSYYANRGTALDLVVQVSVAIDDYLPLPHGKRINLSGEQPAGHQRTTAIHLADGEPVRLLGEVNQGTLVLDAGGAPGEATRGHFTMSFKKGDAYAAGRTLVGTFDMTAADGGFGL